MANYSNAAANALITALATALNNGYIRIYSGSQPATADTAIGGGNTLLAELRFASQAFGSASAGVVTAAAISPVNASATGVATFSRLLASDGTTAHADITVSTSGAELNLNSVSLQSGAQVSITSMTMTQPK